MISPTISLILTQHLLHSSNERTIPLCTNVDLLRSKNEYTMLMNEFCAGYFKPQTLAQASLLERFLELRNMNGTPTRFSILRHLAKTRKSTRSVYPPNWRVS